MEYYDRHGVKIDAAKWGELIRDPKYTVIAYLKLETECVEASWLGVYFPLRERKKLLFLVRQWCDDKRASDDVWFETEAVAKRASDDVWFETEAAAKRYFDSIETDLRRGQKAGKRGAT